uniref:Uncharacterized protein n=1 Tax=Trichuris muris TaxID=70415 RepID=A0A5S6Q7X5_TRIMR
MVHGIQGIHTDHVANHMGNAVGFVNALRSIGLYGYNGGHVIPKELLSRYELSADHFRPEHVYGVSSVIQHIAEHAKAHLQRARSFKEVVPREATGAFLFSAIVDHGLRALSDCSYNPFDPRVQ